MASECATLMLKAMRTFEVEKEVQSRGCLVLGWCFFRHADVAKKCYEEALQCVEAAAQQFPEDVSVQSYANWALAHLPKPRTTGPRRSARRPRPSASSARRASSRPWGRRASSANCSTPGRTTPGKFSQLSSPGREKLALSPAIDPDIGPTRAVEDKITREAENVGFLEGGGTRRTSPSVLVVSLGPGVRCFGSASARAFEKKNKRVIFLMVHGRAASYWCFGGLPFEHLHFILARAAERLDPAPPSRAAACSTHRCEAKGCLARARSEASGCLASLARWGSRLDNNAGLFGGGLCCAAEAARRERVRSTQAGDGEDPREWKMRSWRPTAAMSSDGRPTAGAVRSTVRVVPMTAQVRRTLGELKALTELT